MFAIVFVSCCANYRVGTFCILCTMLGSIFTTLGIFIRQYTSVFVAEFTSKTDIILTGKELPYQRNMQEHWMMD